MEGCTTISCKFTVPGAARNWVLKEECTCQQDNQSARGFSELDKWVARNSNSCEAVSNQIARKQTAHRESCTRPELTELTTALLSHWTIIRKPHQDKPHKRQATRMARASKRWMEGNWTSIADRNSQWKNCEDVSPPQPVRQASILKMPSGVDQSDKGITETPL